MLLIKADEVIAQFEALLEHTAAEGMPDER